MAIPSADNASPAGNKSARGSDSSGFGACVYCYTTTEILQKVRDFICSCEFSWKYFQRCFQSSKESFNPTVLPRTDCNSHLIKAATFSQFSGIGAAKNQYSAKFLKH